MATGHSERNTMVAGKGSDELERFSCSPCAKAGNDARATNYCIDCGEFLCPSCKDFHSRMAALAFHEVLHEGRLSEFSSMNKPSFPCQRCKVHHGRLVDTYCAEHDVVCCTTCVSISHRQCGGINYLPDVATGVKDSDEYQELIGSMTACFQTLDKKQSSLEQDLTATQEMKENGARGVETYIEKVRSYLSTLESSASRQIRAECEKKEREINSALEHVQSLRSVLEKDWENVQGSDTGNESQIFVYTKAGKTTVKETKMQLEQMEEPAKLPVFLLNTSIEEVLGSEQTLGSFSKPAALYGDHEVTCEGDEKGCDITGSCYHPNTGLVLADWANKKVKRLSDTYQVTGSCLLGNAPWAVCFSGTDEVAVTLPMAKRVQFVTVRESLILGSNFKVGKICRGICMKDEKLFISCEGNVGEGAGHLQVYSLQGKHLQTVKKSSNMFNFPLHITASPHSSQIYVADAKVGIVSFLISVAAGDVVCCDSIQGSRAICTAQEHGLFVTDASNSNILQVSTDFNICTEAISNQDNQHRIQSLAYDTVNSRLIATIENYKSIRIFAFSAN